MKPFNRKAFREAMAFTVSPGDAEEMSGRFVNDTWFQQLLSFSGILDQAQVERIPAGYREYPVAVIQAGSPQDLALDNDAGVTDQDMTLTIQTVQAHKITISTEVSALANYQMGGALVGRFGEAIALKILFDIEEAVMNGRTADHEPQGLIGMTGVSTTASVDTAPEILNVEAGLYKRQVQPGNVSWVVSPDTFAAYKAIAQHSTSGPSIVQDFRMYDMPIMVSPHLTANAGIAGDFSQLLIAYFGDPIITLDDVSQMGIIRLQAEWDWDFKAVHPTAFTTVTRA